MRCEHVSRVIKIHIINLSDYRYNTAIHGGVCMKSQETLSRNVGDICNYWNKLVIVHKVDNEEGWAEVLKIKNPNKPSESSGEPFSVRTSQLSLVKPQVS